MRTFFTLHKQHWQGLTMHWIPLLPSCLGLTLTLRPVAHLALPLHLGADSAAAWHLYAQSALPFALGLGPPLGLPQLQCHQHTNYWDWCKNPCTVCLTHYCVCVRQILALQDSTALLSCVKAKIRQQ